MCFASLSHFEVLVCQLEYHVGVFICLCTAGGTDTVATPQSDGTYHLHGYKWFTSATDANMAFTLARVVDNNGLVTNVGYCILPHSSHPLSLPH